MRLYFCLILALCASLYAKADTDYTTGVIFINEDWYGHRNSTVNYLQPDDPEGQYWHYRIIQAENPGVELGCTNQYGAIWHGRLYMIAKQDKDPGAAVTGGRISVADATTMKMIKQLQLIDPSGKQCDGRAFCGVTEKKGYVSSSNGIWKLNLETLEIEGQVEGTANPNAGDDKPNTDPTGSLYVGQTGTMILVGDKVFAVHQQYGMLVIDTASDKVIDVLDMAVVDDAIEADTGVRPSKPSGIGSTLVRSKDGNLWYAAAKNVQGTGAAVPYIIRLDPNTLEREVIRIEGDDMFPPANSWYAWTPDPFCASSVTNRLYWCGGPNSWLTNYRIFRYDIDNRKLEKLIDFSEQPGDWHVYGCSLGIHPVTDELYASMFHKFVDTTYATRRFDADGNLIKEYPMIANYWFPSLPVFPVKSQASITDADIDEADSNVTVVNLNGAIIYSGDRETFDSDIRPAIAKGIYILRQGTRTEKIIL